MILMTYHLPENFRLLGDYPYASFYLKALDLSEWEQTQTCEYAAMRYAYQNPPEDRDNWIGFTSANQHTETRFKSKEEIELLLMTYEVVVWGWHLFQDGLGNPVSLSVASERLHPGITPIMRQLLFDFGHPKDFPIPYAMNNGGPFHNYWLMPKALFREYMEWSLPMIEHCLTMQEHPFFKRWPRATAYIAERLFIIWLFQRGLKYGIANDWRKRVGNLSDMVAVEKQRMAERGFAWVE